MADTVFANVIRDGIVDCRHRGSWALCSPTGQLLYSGGDPDEPYYVRSCAKPFQTLAVIMSGAASRFGFSDKELVVMTASHNSEEPHIKAVRSIMEKAELDEELLQCGTHPPLPRSVQYEMIENGQEFSPLYHNCSGKHVGILALSKHLGAPLEGYKEPGHPAQQALMSSVAAMCQLDRSQIEYGHDGCDIPAYLLTARQMATAAARFASPNAIASPTMRKAIGRLTDAIVAHPYLIAGKKRMCTAIAQHAKGRAIGKVGAEGAYMLALRHRKLGFAAKCSDGAFRGIFTFSANVCDRLGVFDEHSRNEMKAFIRPDVTNDYGRVVGHIEVPHELLDPLNDIPEVG